MLRNKSVVPMIIELLGAHGWGGADAVVLAALRLANVAVSGGDGDGTGPCRNVLAERPREHLNGPLHVTHSYELVWHGISYSLSRSVCSVCVLRVYVDRIDR